MLIMLSYFYFTIFFVLDAKIDIFPLTTKPFTSQSVRHFVRLGNKRKATSPTDGNVALS